MVDGQVEREVRGEREVRKRGKGRIGKIGRYGCTEGGGRTDEREQRRGG